MDRQVAVQERSASIFTPKQITLIRRTVANKANDDEFAIFLARCERTGLDPLNNQIHSVSRGGRQTIQTGIDGYRLIADRTGNYAGSDDAVFETDEEGDHPIIATVTVWKLVAGQRCAFTASARWREYAPAGEQAFMWAKMPFLMLQKCAEAQALRKAFPQDLSGIYTDEEMHQADVVPKPQIVGQAIPMRPMRLFPPTIHDPNDAEPAIPVERPAIAKPAHSPQRMRWAALWRQAQQLKLNVEPISGSESEDDVKARCDELEIAVKAVVRDSPA